MRLRLLAWALLLQPGLLLAQPTTRDTRQALELLQSALDAAVVRVSRPAAAWPAHPAAAGYRLPGYGVVIVLPARALPRPSARPPDPRLAQALSEARFTLEQSLVTADSPEMREQIQRSLEVLQNTQIHLGALPTAPLFPELAPRPHPADERGQPEVERDIEAMHAEMEAFRRQAEQARADAEHDIRMRLSAPATPASLLDAPQPPWHFWFEATTSIQERDSRTPDSVVAAVREAVSSVFEGLRIPYDWLGENETLAVVVDFMPRGAARPERGLIVRARRSDLLGLRKGALDAAELRRRIETEEWPVPEPARPVAAAAPEAAPTREPEPHP